MVAFGFVMLHLLVPSSANRRLLWVTIGRVVASPIVMPAFRDGYLGDVFTSFSTPLQQIVTFFHVSFATNGTFDMYSRIPDGTSMNLTAAAAISSNYTTDSTSLAPPTWALALCSGLPLWFRLMQNAHIIFRFKDNKKAVANACKYAISLALVILSSFGKISSSYDETDTSSYDIAYFWGYIFCYTISTLYSWIWDVTMDWGLIVCKKAKKNNTTISSVTMHEVSQSIDESYVNEKDNSNNVVTKTDEKNRNADTQLINTNNNGPVISSNKINEGCKVCGYTVTWRPMRAFSKPVYIIASILDLFLRAIWAFNLSPATSPLTFFKYVQPILGMIEITRRFMWTIFRIEFEHLKHSVSQVKRFTV